MAQLAEASSSGTRTRRKLSVLHLVHTMAYGGIETILLNWVRAIDRETFDVHLACFGNPGATETPFVEAAADRGLEVSKIPWARRKPIVKASRALLRLLRERRVDVLHTHNCYADIVGAVASRFAPVKTITTIYVWGDFGWKRNVLQRVNSLAVRGFDQITAHCETTLARTVDHGFRPERIKTLVCGFEATPASFTKAERQRRRREMGVGDSDVVLANIARCYPEKAQDFLLECFREITREHPGTKLWIAGVGPLEARLKELCLKLDLENCVRFLGFVKNLDDLLALADIQVHPAHDEGVPQAVCAGMAAELPIVASDVGGIPEVIHDGRTGLLVPHDDKKGFVEAVGSLIGDSEKGRRLGRAARSFVENEYSLASAVRALEETYLGLVES